MPVGIALRRTVRAKRSFAVASAGMPIIRIGRHARWSMTVASALVLTTLGVPALAATPSVAQSTVVGIHNTYTKADFPYLAKALDAGASMVELDAWDDVFTREWKVSHD